MFSDMATIIWHIDFFPVINQAWCDVSIWNVFYLIDLWNCHNLVIDFVRLSTENITILWQLYHMPLHWVGVKNSYLSIAIILKEKRPTPVKWEWNSVCLSMLHIFSYYYLWYFWQKSKNEYCFLNLHFPILCLKSLKIL